MNLQQNFGLHFGKQSIASLSVGAVIVCLVLFNAAVLAKTRVISLSLLPTEEHLISMSGRCSGNETLDMPARAFRDYNDLVHLMATDEFNRELIGPNFGNVKLSCDSPYHGADDSDPSWYSDRQWMTSFATEDGKRIAAVIHNEFQGNLRPSLCPSKVYIKCWWNALTFAFSEDGGFTFHAPPSPNNLIATPPYKYDFSAGRPIGYFQPTNIVKSGGYYYVIFRASALLAQRGGACIARTRDPFDPKSWRAWGGSYFDVAFVDPYAQFSDGEGSHVCVPIDNGKFFDPSSLLVDEDAGTFIMLSSIAHGQGDAYHLPGAYVSTSSNLIDWSESRLLASENDLYRQAEGKRFHFGFFALIDERSPRRDFGSISMNPELFLYYVKFDNFHLPYARALAKRAVFVEHF